MNETRLNASILAKMKFPGDKERLDQALKEAVQQNPDKLVVLDDDPTGVQTVHDISVYTNWDEESILAGFREEKKCFYILTNSRGLSAAESKAQHEEIIKNLLLAKEKTGKNFLLISRSDSTLRGHYPLEPETLRKGLEDSECKLDGEILCFFFQEGGRYTMNDVHYVLQGEELVPAAQTEFAQDKTFGYHASDLKEYVEEKTQGAYTASSVVSIGLDALNAEDVDGICEKLLEVKDFQKVVVNATCPEHIQVFALAVYRAIGMGKNFLFRSAAALVKEMAGISSRPLLTREEMLVGKEKGGLVVVGSYTQKTTDQLQELLRSKDLVEIHFHSSLVLDEEKFEAEIQQVQAQMNEAIHAGKDTVVFTDRELLSIPGESKEAALARSVKISEALCRIVAGLKEQPSFMIAKGGITSSVIGTQALQAKKALVMGQIYPGIPVWKLGQESCFPGMAYVIFPGNVGGEEALRKVYEVLKGDQ